MAINSNLNPNSYTVIYSNVAGSGDLQNLWMQNPDESKFQDKRLYNLIDSLLNSPSPQTQEEKLAESQKRSDLGLCADEAYRSLAQTAFRKIIKEQPDLICLGEFNPGVKDHKGIAKELKEGNYGFVTGNKAFDTNVAYNKDRFVLIQEKLTKGEAIFVDLQDTVSKRVIRVVADHVAGFNGVQQKADTKIVKKSIDSLESVLKAKEGKRVRVNRGDQNLDDTLKEILDINEKEKFKPSMIIYTADLNTTPTYVKDRLHPKRFQKLIDAGFIADDKDSEPTIVDPNFKKALKYDVIVARALTEQLTVSVQSKPLEKAGSLKFVMDYTTFPSDHAPVEARIEVQGEESTHNSSCMIQ